MLKMTLSELKEAFVIQRNGKAQRKPSKLSKT
jgi:hypothetical protein